jgi:hypothetical protein
MRFTSSILTACLACSASTAAFAPASLQRSSTKSTSTSARFSTTATSPPERVAPGAGWEPEWNDSVTGLPPSEFIQSDMNKPDIAGMWECPLTRWDADGIDVVAAQKAAASVPHCPLEQHATPAENAMGAAYFSENSEKIRADLLKYGAIWFRGFDLMKSVQGYRAMHEAIGLEPCLDPLHSSGLRKFASERDALYEEVRNVRVDGRG